MRSIFNVNGKKNKKSFSDRLAAASLPVLETIESRLMMSTTVAAWNFDSLTVQTTPAQLSPPTSTGTGTALTVGLQTSGSNANSPGGSYAYPNVNASGTGDISDILNGTGNNPSGNQADHSSTGATSDTNTTGVNPAWRLRGSSDGWTSNAALGSQGAQFAASTVGVSGITFSFDLDPSSTSAASEIAVQYTTDGTTWVEANNLTAPTAATDATDGVTVVTNSTNPNIVTGSYFQIANNSDALYWQNGFSASLTGVTAANNDSHFAVRIVNAATGTAEVEVGGTALPAAGAGNWRLDNVQIVANGGTVTAPTVTTTPSNQSVPAGQSVTFTAAASGNPTPTVQWFTGNPGSGTAISGATSATYTFITSSAASDNGTSYYAEFTNSGGVIDTTAATLTDTLAAPVVTTQPTAVATAAGNTATFTAIASGSPVPTVQWQSEPAGSTTFTNIPGATSTTYSVTATTTISGTKYQAVFTNSQSSVISNAVTLTATGTVLAGWSFPATVAAPDNNPAATSGVYQTSALASSLGMTNTYTYGSTTATNSVTNDDITSVAGSVTENDWRVRGHYVATGTAPNVGTPTNSGNVNGWNLNAPQYSQGVEFDVSTVGYQTVQASFDWESTSQGVKNLQEQYSLNVSSGTWTNINTPLIAIAGNYRVGNTIDLSGIAGANNDANFGIRFVSIYDPNGAADGLTQVTDANGTHYPYASSTSGPYNNTSGNWGFDNIQVTGTQIPVAPAITAQPTAQSVASGATATFTAAASGFPTPTVQWYTGTPGSGTPITGATSASYTTPATTVALTGTTYYAVFTNNLGSATTNAGTLTVTAAPQITAQPFSQTVTAGTTNVTFTAAASGTPAPTVQWEVETPGSSTFVPVSGTNYTGATSNTLTLLTADEGLSGNQYEAIYTNSSGTADTNPATLTVIGTPIAQWIFTGGEAPSPAGNTSAGTGNSPYPTFGPLTNTSGTLGFVNDYTGVQAYPESDILIERSTLNSSYSEYDWRVRAGNGSGPTGSPGSPEGWSQDAPQYDNSNIGSTIDGELIAPQGVMWAVNTSGYSDISFQFDWNQGGISNMQPQYSPDGGTTWISAPSGLITATSNDFYGITSNTSSAVPILVNLQSISAANNNPNFEFRLVAAYSPSLPLISDGNQLDPAVHGQFATGAPTAVNAQQVIQFGNDLNSNTDVSGGTFTLTYGTQTTSAIAFDTNPTTLASNITTALNALTGLTGNFSVALTNYNSSGNALNPERDGLGVTASDMTVTFKGALAATAVSTLTANNVSLTGSNPSVVVQDYVNGSAAGFAPYVDGGGAWQIGNISFNGVSTSNSGLTVTSNPIATQVAGGGVGTFTATAYSESAPTVTWQVSTDGGNSWTTATGSTTPTTFTQAANNSYTSTFSYTSHTNLSDNGYEFRAVFTAGSSNVDSSAAVLTVVAPVAPTVTTQPASTSVQAGNVATITAIASYATAPAPTVQWQVSTNGGTTWTNTVDSTGAYSGSTTVTNGGSSVGYIATLTITSLADASQNGYLYRAVFTNAVAPVDSNPATLTVLTAETNLTTWNFNLYKTSDGSGPNDSNGIGTGYTNSAAPTSGVIDQGSVTPVGMTLPYLASDAASGTDGNGAVPADDILSSPGALNTSFKENTYRVRGGVTSVSGGTPANGWSNFAPEYTQGVQVSAPTTGYQKIYVTLDWYSTTSGILDAQPQYTTDGSTWINLGSQIQAVSNDFYGATATGSPVPLVFDVSNISAANSNPNFAIRLVSAWDPLLPTVTTPQYTDGTFTNIQTVTHGQYANAALVGNPPVPAVYNGSKGNWRFANIEVHGVVQLPTWLASNSIATWNAASHSLVVSGASSIIGDPGTDEPIITFTGAGSTLTINTGTTRTVNVGSIAVTGGNSVVMASGSTTHVLIDQGGLTTSAGNTLNIGNNVLDLQNVALNSVVAQITANTLITSDTSAGTLGAIGSIVNGSDFTSSNQFDSVTPGTSDVLVRYTYFGDANLDGRVDGSDYTKVDNGYINTLAGWANGDFNYDNIIDGSDYTLIDNAFNVQGAPITPASQISSKAVAAIPSNNVFSTSSASIWADFLKKDHSNTVVSAIGDPD